MIRLILISAISVLILSCSSALPALGVGSAAKDPTPMYAHYYIWFNPTSWDRAKTNYPLLGRYSSDEQTVMRKHIRLAKAAGIQGFIVSWKSTPTLDSRLAKLVKVARQQHFRLAIIYQGLNFHRRPLPVSKVKEDLDLFVRRYGKDPVFAGFGRPVFAWSGSWRFSSDQIKFATELHRKDVKLLGTEKDPADYLEKAKLFDGNLYYWSSVNPFNNTNYPIKLRKMSSVVHANGGIWFAPVAPGFDGRLVGGASVVSRKGDETLRRQLNAAAQSAPDAYGIISWNEFSENTNIEPSVLYGTTALKAVAEFRGANVDFIGDFDSSEPAARQDGLGSIAILFAVIVLIGGGVFVQIRRRRLLERRHKNEIE